MFNLGAARDRAGRAAGWTFDRFCDAYGVTQRTCSAARTGLTGLRDSYQGFNASLDFVENVVVACNPFPRHNPERDGPHPNVRHRIRGCVDRTLYFPVEATKWAGAGLTSLWIRGQNREQGLPDGDSHIRRSLPAFKECYRRQVRELVRLEESMRRTFDAPFYTRSSAPDERELAYIERQVHERLDHAPQGSSIRRYCQDLLDSCERLRAIDAEVRTLLRDALSVEDFEAYCGNSLLTGLLVSASLENVGEFLGDAAVRALPDAYSPMHLVGNFVQTRIAEPATRAVSTLGQSAALSCVVERLPIARIQNHRAYVRSTVLALMLLAESLQLNPVTNYVTDALGAQCYAYVGFQIAMVGRFWGMKYFGTEETMYSYSRGMAICKLFNQGVRLCLIVSPCRGIEPYVPDLVLDHIGFNLDAYRSLILPTSYTLARGRLIQEQMEEHNVRGLIAGTETATARRRLIQYIFGNLPGQLERTFNDTLMLEEAPQVAQRCLMRHLERSLPQVDPAEFLARRLPIDLRQRGLIMSRDDMLRQVSSQVLGNVFDAQLKEVFRRCIRESVQFTQGRLQESDSLMASLDKFLSQINPVSLSAFFLRGFNRFYRQMTPEQKAAFFAYKKIISQKIRDQEQRPVWWDVGSPGDAAAAAVPSLVLQPAHIQDAEERAFRATMEKHTRGLLPGGTLDLLRRMDPSQGLSDQQFQEILDNLEALRIIPQSAFSSPEFRRDLQKILSFVVRLIGEQDPGYIKGIIDRAFQEGQCQEHLSTLLDILQQKHVIPGTSSRERMQAIHTLELVFKNFIIDLLLGGIFLQIRPQDLGGLRPQEHLETLDHLRDLLLDLSVDERSWQHSARSSFLRSQLR